MPTMDVIENRDTKLNLFHRIQTNGEGDYVNSDGDLVFGVNQRGVMVTAEADLANLPTELYAPGSVAFTAGFKAMWQLGADGEWVDMMADEDTDDDETEPE